MIPIAESAAIADIVRIRPAVSWVESKDSIIEFFFGNTRRQKRVKVTPQLVAAMRHMNGNSNLASIAGLLEIPQLQLLDWTSQLIEWSVVERMEVAVLSLGLFHR